MSRQITKAEYWGQTIQDGFFGDYRELIAHFGGVTEGITSYLQLNFAEELIAFSKKPDPRLYRRLLTEALVTLIDRSALTQVSDFNALAESDLAKLRRETGIGVETLPPTPPKAPTADELLEQEVRNDYANLPGDRMREKRRNSRAYETMFQKIADRLDSRVTANVRAGA
jgi:hypothetical protein